MCRILYFLLDHPLYLKRIGVLKMNSKVATLLEWRKNVLRLTSIIICIFLDIVELHHIKKHIKALVRPFDLMVGQTEQTRTLSRSKAEMDSRSQQIAVESKEDLRRAWHSHYLKLLDIGGGLLEIPLSLHYMTGTSEEVAALCGVVTSWLALDKLLR